MAGVAGFEPTNDGVRGAFKPLKSPFFTNFLAILEQIIKSVPLKSPESSPGLEGC